MKTLITSPPTGGINFLLLCEEAVTQFGGDFLGVNILADDTVAMHFTDSSTVTQEQVDTFVTAHDAEQKSDCELADEAIAAAMAILSAVDTTSGSVAFDASLFASLITAARGC